MIKFVQPKHSQSMKKPLIVGITGGSGSGKTTFINQLRSRFPKDAICVVSQDDYYRPKKDQEVDDQGITNFDLPKSINKKEFVQDLKQLIDGRVVCRPEYTFNNDQVKPKMLTFKPSPIIIVEGIFVFHFKKVRNLLDLKVFLHAKENLKVIRRIKRDQIERNYPLDDVFYRYEHHVLPTFEKYIKPYMEEADLIVNNNSQFDMGLEVLSGFVENYIRNYSQYQPNIPQTGSAPPSASLP